MDIREEVFQGWKLNLSDEHIVFPDFAKEQADAILSEWPKAFPKENTWVQQELGIPSLICRLDCIIDGDKLKIFEIEERPAGIGVTISMNPDFSLRLKDVMKNWPEFSAVIAHDRKAGDDCLWIPKISLEDALGSDGLLLLRAEPHQHEFHSLQGRSVSSFLEKGNKSYGLALGLWNEISIEDFDSLPWDSGFCLKPIQNSKCRDVEIWHPVHSKKNSGIGGCSTKTRIKKTLERNKTMYLQDMLESTDSLISGFKMIFRVFFGYSVIKGEFEFLGGVWNARQNLKIHGAPDTIMGPVM